MADPTVNPSSKSAHTDSPARTSTWVKASVVALIIFAVGVVLITNRWMTERFTETTRNKAELRLALYSGNVVSELQRTSVVPLLLSRDATISDALTKGDYAHASQRLIQVQADISVASILLLDTKGRAVGATDRTLLGTPYTSAPFYVQAMQSSETVFSTTPREGGGYDFTYSQQVFAEGKSVGVIVVAVDLMKFERAWAALQGLVLVTDSEGTVRL